MRNNTLWTPDFGGVILFLAGISIFIGFILTQQRKATAFFRNKDNFLPTFDANACLDLHRNFLCVPNPHDATIKFCEVCGVTRVVPKQ